MRFEDMDVWKRSSRLSVSIYQHFADLKDYGLKDQITRAAGSAMDNVAEGFDGGSNAEFARFLSYSQRSCSEVQSQLYRALDCGYINEQQLRELYDLANHTRSKVGGLIKYLKSTKNNAPGTRNGGGAAS